MRDEQKTGPTGRVYPPDGVDVVLRNGSTVLVRPVTANDEALLAEFLRGISPDSARLRFFATASSEALGKVAHDMIPFDPPNGTISVVAMSGATRAVGHATCCPTENGRAEVGFLIADAFQGQGLGSALLGQLAQIASEGGIHTFEAAVLPQNHQMLNVFKDSGFDVHFDAEPGEITVTFATDLTEATRQRFESRDWTSAVNAVRSFLHPKSVAVIGASRRRGTIAGEVFHNLLDFGFQGRVVPVNSCSDVVQSVVAYPHVEDVPGKVDLAVIVVPREAVLEVAEACGRKGVRALVVISAGFAETGTEGRAQQEQLVRICRETGMRLIGPNCMGILNTDPEVLLNATFAPTAPPPGCVAFMSQSGALGLAVIDYAGSLGLGLSSFVSVGNKADISGNDLLRYWDQDESTDVILLYLESFGNPRRFSSIAREVARRKPIIAVKSGRSLSGGRASGSHTGALLSASDVTVDALFRQTGVIRTETLEQMFDVASLLANQPAPKGRRVAILTNAGGPGILCADSCEAAGLEVPLLAEETQVSLRAVLAKEASVSNPVDMIASASAAQYEEAIRIIGKDPNVDALIVIFIPPLVTRPEDVASAIVEGAKSLAGEKTVLSVFMQARGVPEQLRKPGVRIPSYAFPEGAAIALAKAAGYGEWRERPVDPIPVYDDLKRAEAAGIVAEALTRGDGWLTPAEVQSLLQCYGLPILETRSAATVEEAAAIGAELGVPVALKAVGPGLLHKTEAGAVQLGVAADQIAQVATAMRDRLLSIGNPPSGFLIQPMAQAGVEMIVGVVHDPQFGPVVACGAGGVLVELIKDVSVRLTPLTRRDAVEMVDELRTRPLLSGYRGSAPADVAALVDGILRVSALVEDLPQILELDLNPILIHPKGATIVDARVRVAAVGPMPLLGTR